MLRALYTSGTAMLVQGKRMDVVTNNIANIETNGYKKDLLVSRSFRDMMIERIKDDPSIVSAGTNFVGPHNTGVHIDQIYTGFQQGALETTTSSTDFALEGDGFFAVETPEGERYTRDGAFNIDSLGYLVTNDGRYVLGADGQRLLIGSEDFSVDSLGNINADGTMAGRLRIVSFADLSVLRKQGDNLVYPFDGSAPEVSGAAVMQRALEKSNVEASEEIVRMIEISRNYEANQRIVKMLDDSLGRAVNEIARF